MEIIYKKQFQKDLIRLPNFVQKAVKETIDILKKSQNMQSTGLDFKYLNGQKKDENYIRIRIGGYRIGAELIKPNIILITCGSRGDVYKGFP
jgi:mRNA interferase RelE/StbE